MTMKKVKRVSFPEVSKPRQFRSPFSFNEIPSLTGDLLHKMIPAGSRRESFLLSNPLGIILFGYINHNNINLIDLLLPSTSARFLSVILNL